MFGRIVTAFRGLVGSKKVLTAILGALTVIGAKVGLTVDDETFWAIATVFGILIASQGLADLGKATNAPDAIASFKEALYELAGSKKFWTALLNVGQIIAAKKGLEVDSQTFWGVTGVLMALQTTQGLTGIGKGSLANTATAAKTTAPEAAATAPPAALEAFGKITTSISNDPTAPVNAPTGGE